MHAFKAGDHTWEVTIDVAAAMRVEKFLHIDLYALAEDGFKPLEKLLRNPIKLVNVVYVLCEEQVTKAGLKDEDFGRGLAGDTLAGLMDAFIEELFAFFPDPALRRTAMKLRQAAKGQSAAAVKEIEAIIDDFDPEEEVRKLMKSQREAPTSSVPSGAAPPS